MAGLDPSDVLDAAAPRSHSLTLRDITHRYGSLAAVRDVNLDIRAGELVALLGPSGCGKTTLLRAMAGFINPSHGDILVDGNSVTGIPPHRRGMGIVFQNYALFPHMSTSENVAYGLRARRTPKNRVAPRVRQMLELVKLEHLAERKPSQLSGGQQQRVALARALAVQPRILLLDEPLSALDKNLRLDMQIEIKRLQREFGITTVMVTHDQDEAMTMADRIAVIDSGAVEQFAPPTEIYDRPATMFVNEFIGTTNLLPGTLIQARDRRCRVHLDGGATLDLEKPPPVGEGERVLVSVRPEGFELCDGTDADEIKGRVLIAMPLGPSIIYDVELEKGLSVKVVVSRSSAAARYGESADVGLRLQDRNGCSVFPEKTFQHEE